MPPTIRSQPARHLPNGDSVPVANQSGIIFLLEALHPDVDRPYAAASKHRLKPFAINEKHIKK